MTRLVRLPVAKIPRISEGEEALMTQIRTQLPADVPRPVREYPFDPEAAGRKWRFDFAWPEERLAVEVEGGIWTQGRHTRGSTFENELRKYNRAALAGWCVLRLSTEMIVENGRSMDEGIGYVLEALTYRFRPFCERCRRTYAPLLYTEDRARHTAVMPNGYTRCEGHGESCSPGCTSDHK
jgi:very-short-patch-repair endonuclease